MGCCAKIGKFLLTTHAAVTGWKHRSLSFVEQDDFHQSPMIAALSKEMLTVPTSVF